MLKRYIAVRTAIPVGIALRGSSSLCLFMTLLFAFGIETRLANAQTYEVVGGTGRDILDLNHEGVWLTTKRVRNSSRELISVGSLILIDSAYGLAPGAYKLPGIDPEQSIGLVLALNDSGVVVGLSRNASGDFRPTKWIAGGPPIEIPDPAGLPASRTLWPKDINNSGMICGGFALRVGPPTSTPFSLDGLNFVNLKSPECSSNDPILSSIKINNSGDVMGNYSCRDTGDVLTTKRGIWRSGTLPMEEIPDSFIGGLRDFNNRGQIVASKRILDSTRAVIFGDSFQETVLPWLDSANALEPTSINDLGEVVGYGRYKLTGQRDYFRAFLWLPESNYGLSAGMHNLHGLVSPEIPSLGNLVRAHKINNKGQIVIERNLSDASSHTAWRIISPVPPPGLIVNSIGDEPDLNPGDSLCETSSGDCTLRAAIMEANAQAGLDTIRFDISGGGIPVIRPSTELPHIKDVTLIDGLSQPGRGMVILDGSNVLDTIRGTNGLTISSSKNEVRGLVIQNFSASGIHIDSGDFNSIHSNYIGTDATGENPEPNFLHGIHVSSSINKIHAGFLGAGVGNVIAYNLGAGVFVDSGLFAVQVADNSIFENGSLGIDLYPSGVNKDDSLQGRDGSNSGIQAPTIFSITHTDFSGTIIRGSFGGSLLKTYEVELYANDDCDNSGTGEGKRFLGSKDGLNAGTVFSITTFESVDSSEYITATITDFDNNTSEFSACWPNKTLKLVDANGDSLAQKSFILSRIANDAPIFTDTLVDTILTDAAGMIDLAKYYTTGKLGLGDSLRFEQLIHTEFSVKHPTLIASAYRVYLDNAKFDTLGVMSYDKLDTLPSQTITLNHTTIAYSLVVSLEWDADLAYINSLEQGFRNMSNYLYDVSDGQMRLDSIAIFDNKEFWDFSDIQIYASNLIHPHADRIGGILHAFGDKADPMEMPIKWFGGEGASRNGTFSEHPLDMAAAISYRTFAHEFGHYALFLDDEYAFPIRGATRCADRPLGTPNWKPYGYMDYHYIEGLVYSSELSTANAYSNATCRNNWQWKTHSKSCWQTVDSIFQKSYSGILSPILRPAERDLAAGLDYLPGPNDNMANLDYDVGALVSFPITHTPPTATSFKVRVFKEADPSSETLPNTFFALIDTTFDQKIGDIKLGRTSDNGGIWIVGRRQGHLISTGGYLQILSISRSRATARGRSWYYGTEPVIEGDSLLIGLAEVKGDKTLINDLQLEADSLIYRLNTLGAFATTPTLSHHPDGGDRSSYSFTSDPAGYSVAITDSLAASGWFRLQVVDDSNATYFFQSDYTTSSMDTSTVATLKGPGNISNVTIDNTSNSVERAILLSTPYPVPQTGLTEFSIQAGPTQTLATLPETNLSGDNGITIRYSEKDLEGVSGIFGEESSLQIFHWDTNQGQWVIIGGTVDTIFNEVSSSITKSGVYAAFTTDLQTDVEEDPETESALPKRFELLQNFPNPFNPTTTISYSLRVKADVEISVYNILGQKIRVFAQGLQSAGRYEVVWNGLDNDGSAVASGVYFYRIRAGEFTSSKKMILLK